MRKVFPNYGSYVTLYDLLNAGFFNWVTATELEPTTS